MVRVYRKRKVNVMRVAAKLVGSILGLYIAGYLVNTLGSVLNNTASQFYRGFTMIGWTLEDHYNATFDNCQAQTTTNEVLIRDCITDYSSSGILAIVGLVAIASVVFEFVSVKI